MHMQHYFTSECDRFLLNEKLASLCTHIFTEASEALGSGPLLVEHGVDLVHRVGQLAKSLQ